MTGIVLGFDVTRGTGFILRDERDEEYAVHHRDIRVEDLPLRCGDLVSFTSTPAKPLPRARNIRVLARERGMRSARRICAERGIALGRVHA